MTAHTFAGPQEYTFPHQQALDGKSGTLVLIPGRSYDFGTDATGQPVRPIGPAWWWDPQPPPEPEPESAAGPVPAKAAPLVPLADIYDDSYDSEPVPAAKAG